MLLVEEARKPVDLSEQNSALARKPFFKPERRRRREATIARMRGRHIA